MLFSVKSMAAHQRERRDDRRRNRERRDDHGPDVPDEEHDDERREQAAPQQVFLERFDRRVDEAGIVRIDGQRDAARQRLPHAVQFLLHRLGHLDRVLARRAPDIELHGGTAVCHVQRAQHPRGRILGVADIGDPDRRAVDRRDDDVVELVGRIDAAHRPQADFPFALLERAARNFDVLLLDRVAHLIDRETAGVQLLDIDHDVDFARPIAADAHVADAVHGFQRPLDLLVGNLGQRSQADAFAGEHHAHDRIGVRILLLNDRRQHFRRHVPHRAGDLLADRVRGVFEVAVEEKSDVDRRRCRRR